MTRIPLDAREWGNRRPKTQRAVWEEGNKERGGHVQAQGTTGGEGWSSGVATVLLVLDCRERGKSITHAHSVGRDSQKKNPHKFNSWIESKCYIDGKGKGADRIRKG